MSRPATAELCMSDFLSLGLLKMNTNQKEINLRTWALSNGWNGTSAAAIEVVNGVWIWSDNNNVPALTTGAPWPNGVRLINNGKIIGKGGVGYGLLPPFSNRTGEFGVRTLGVGSGGTAISLSAPITITNNGYIAGGGGGGGGNTGGGGAGGGNGGSTEIDYYTGYYDVFTGSWFYGILAGGKGGTLDNSGTPGQTSLNSFGFYGAYGYGGTGGGGGRILPGTGGAGARNTGFDTIAHGNGGGAGGGGGGTGGVNSVNRQGGNGGSAGNVGSPAAAGGGGGGWGAAGGSGLSSYPYRTINGGAGGRAIALNGFLVNFPATGIRYGGIS